MQVARSMVVLVASPTPVPDTLRDPDSPECSLCFGLGKVYDTNLSKFVTCSACRGRKQKKRKTAAALAALLMLSSCTAFIPDTCEGACEHQCTDQKDATLCEHRCKKGCAGGGGAE